MKTLALFFAGMLIITLSFAQNPTFPNEQTETKVIAPKFCTNDKIIQGETYKTIDEFLSKNIVYPELSVSCNIQGTEVVRFTVSASGDISGFRVINSVCKKMDEEVIKVLKLTNGMWQPAYVNGQPVSMEKDVSVSFILHPSNDFVKMAKSYMKQGNKLFFEKNNPKKALKFYDMGITLLPYNETLLAVRGLCKYELGDETGAHSDWERLTTQIDGNSVDPAMENLPVKVIQTRGYSEMMLALKK